MTDITVVSLGCGHPEDITVRALSAIKSARRVFILSDRMPAAELLKREGVGFSTMDDLYDAAEDFDTLADRIAERLIAAAPLCYAVFDASRDEGVKRLAKRAGESIKLSILPGVSEASAVEARALSHGAETMAGVLSVSANSFSENMLQPDMPIVITEINSRILAGDVKLKLSRIFAPEQKIYYERGQRMSEIELAELDRRKEYDHTSSVYVPAASLDKREGYTVSDLCGILGILLGENGCPWDREQTHESLRKYLIEEAYETVDAIDSGDTDKMCDELGDVLLQVVFHACLAEKHGEFDIKDVATSECKKMIRRHEHIFGSRKLESADAVNLNWENVKRAEKGLSSVAEAMRDIPASFPALMRAEKVQDKARKVGFDWQKPEEALEKVHEEANEVLEELKAGRDPAEELGDLLLSVVNVVRLSSLSPEIVLKSAVDKFVRRFESMEKLILSDGKSLECLTLTEMDVYWVRVKADSDSAIH
ncbi:MAG: nucleoside triphosphate pyrophosphohydrolase [Eubacteriales bacterium]|nr:nucleoside triphosphate pyrophosphohydrolase [Eubacteriales bacterium]MDD4512675.1 nucleoside triphosphate pyrophosphohydrolase [Eubacteriales bacterium]